MSHKSSHSVNKVLLYEIKSHFFLAFFLSSCSTREFVIGTTTGKIVAEYSNMAQFRIGDDFECDKAIIDSGMKEGLIPQCIEKTGKPSKIKLVYVGNPKYATSRGRGISPGDSVSKVLRVYGQPKATHLDFGMQENSIHWECKERGTNR